MEIYSICRREVKRKSPDESESATDGVPTPPELLAGVRAAAALAVLALSWRAVRRWNATWGAIALLALATGYLMVFNPRTEVNTYVVLGPAVAVFAAWAFLVERRPAIGWMLAAIGLGIWVGDFGLTQVVTGTQREWLRPSLAIVFLGYVTWLVLAGREHLKVATVGVANNPIESQIAEY